MGHKKLFLSNPLPECRLFDDCEASLCPLYEGSIEYEVWYPDEPVCRKRGAPQWVKMQKAIVKFKTPSDKYFTVAMLEAIKRLHKSIEGINPDQSLAQAKEAERSWIKQRSSGALTLNRLCITDRRRRTGSGITDRASDPNLISVSDIKGSGKNTNRQARKNIVK